MANKEYRVKWEIDIYAKSPKAAAKKALKIQRDPKSTATVFDVGIPCWSYLKVTKKSMSIDLE
jgi:hypothetical protein